MDDDHDDVKGWIAPDKWLILANVERAHLYKKWVRTGLVTPTKVDTTFTGSTVSLTGVLAVVGVAEDTGGSGMRVLRPAQSAFGRYPFWRSATEPKQSRAATWAADGISDSVTITLDPPVTTGSYVVRTVPTVTYATDPATTVDIPFGTDERLVLGMARRAHLKDSTASAALERLLALEDAETALSAFGKLDGDSPRVRRVKPTVSRVHTLDSTPRSIWLFLG